MPELKRITPEEALDDFVSQNLKAARNEYFVTENCTCGLGAKAKSLGLEQFSGNFAIHDVLLGIYGRDYHDGFVRGFDGAVRGYVTEDEVRYSQGYEDGQAAWEAVKHLAIQNEGEES